MHVLLNLDSPADDEPLGCVDAVGLDDPWTLQKLLNQIVPALAAFVYCMPFVPYDRVAQLPIGNARHSCGINMIILSGLVCPSIIRVCIPLNAHPTVPEWIVTASLRAAAMRACSRDVRM